MKDGREYPVRDKLLVETGYVSEKGGAVRYASLGRNHNDATILHPVKNAFVRVPYPNNLKFYKNNIHPKNKQR